MNELIISDIARDALHTALFAAGPALIVSMIVGLSISIFQVVTSLQDQTVAFVPKVVAVMATVVICFPWMMRLLTGFAARMFTDFNLVVKALN
jgi:flagellar biosynthetic protein FliQ